MHTSTVKDLMGQKGFLKTQQFLSSQTIVELNRRLQIILSKNIEHFSNVSMSSSKNAMDDFDKLINDRAVTKLILDKTLKEAVEDEYYLEVSQAPALKILFKEITGGNLEYLHFHLKPNLSDDNSRTIPWHQDQFYNKSEHSDYSEFSSLWIPLTDIGSNGGGLIVIEHSHFGGSVHHEQYKDTGMFTILPEGKSFDGKYLHLTCQKGDGIVLDSKTIHCSAANSSGKNRWALVFFLYGNKS